MFDWLIDFYTNDPIGFIFFALYVVLCLLVLNGFIGTFRKELFCRGKPTLGDVFGCLVVITLCTAFSFVTAFIWFLEEGGNLSKYKSGITLNHLKYLLLFSPVLCLLLLWLVE